MAGAINWSKLDAEATSVGGKLELGCQPGGWACWACWPTGGTSKRINGGGGGISGGCDRSIGAAVVVAWLLNCTRNHQNSCERNTTTLLRCDLVSLTVSFGARPTKMTCVMIAQCID